MHTVNLIANAIKGKEDYPALPEKRMQGVCCITGQEGECVLRKAKITNMFANHDRMLAPKSSHISCDAFIALSYKWERMSVWWCDGVEFKRPKRIEVRDMVLNGVDAKQWVGYVTTSYKKHGALFTKINNGRYGFWRFEMKTVDCRDIEKVREWYNVLNDAVHNEIGRTVVESLNCSPFLIGKIGLKRWIEFEQWAKPKYQSNLYQFLCYLLPSQEERKEEKQED